MTLTRSAVEAMAPDQNALQAASALLKPSKWPLLAQSEGVIWGECQGSGANPYRVAADTGDRGSKCTCPSRKFPCKHAIALMWLFATDGAPFKRTEAPEWVNEWRGRRRKTGEAPVAAILLSDRKLPDIVTPLNSSPSIDPAVEARRQAAAEKRVTETERSVRAATEELDLWIEDQLRTGLPGFLADLSGRCRRIAARLVDAKAGALASRIDEMPARLLPLPAEERIDAAICELGKLVLLNRAWRADPRAAELRREVVGAEAREDLVNDPEAPRVTALWEVLGDNVATRRDGLVSVATWLMSLGEEAPRFALLLDFFPASAGRRSGAFGVGERFKAEITYYPASDPVRAVITNREASTDLPGSWPTAPEGDPLAVYSRHLLAAPWRLESPILLPDGRICEDETGRHWWQSGDTTLPLAAPCPTFALGAKLEAAVGIWGGTRLSLIAAQSDWGRLAFGS